MLAFFSKLASAVFGKLGGWFGGIAGWLAQWILTRLLKAAFKFINDRIEAHRREQRRKAKVEQALKDYEESIGQKMSNEERRKRAEAVLSSIDE